MNLTVKFSKIDSGININYPHRSEFKFGKGDYFTYNDVDYEKDFNRI